MSVVNASAPERMALECLSVKRTAIANPIVYMSELIPPDPAALAISPQQTSKEIARLLDDLEGATQVSEERWDMELSCAREESRVLLLRLQDLQEELEYYFLENQRKDQKLLLLTSRLELMGRMLCLQSRYQYNFIGLLGRIFSRLPRGRLALWR